MKQIDAMFGFIWTQPIHVTLRQMRILPVSILLSSQALLWVIVGKLDKLDPTQAAMAYGTIAVTLITAIWKGIDSLHKPHIKDDKD